MDQIHDRVAGLDVHRDRLRFASRCGARGGGDREGAVQDHDGGLAELAAGWPSGRLPGRDGGHRGLLEAGLLRVGGALRGVGVQRPPRQERPGPQDGLVRCRVAGRCGRPRDGPAQFRAPAADPGAAGADPLPQDPDRRPGAGIARLDKLLQDAGVKLSSVASKVSPSRGGRWSRPSSPASVTRRSWPIWPRAGCGQAPAADRGAGRSLRRPPRHRRGPDPGPPGLPGRHDHRTRRADRRADRRALPAERPGCWLRFPGWNAGASRSSSPSRVAPARCRAGAP